MALKRAALAVAGFVAGRNAISVVFDVEEGVFVALAIFAVPAVLLAALIRPPAPPGVDPMPLNERPRSPSGHVTSCPKMACPETLG